MLEPADGPRIDFERIGALEFAPRLVLNRAAVVFDGGRRRNGNGDGDGDGNGKCTVVRDFTGNKVAFGVGWPLVTGPFEGVSGIVCVYG